MRLLTLLAVMGVFASAAVASVSVDIYLADEMTPLALADPNKPGLYRDIMVGTKLTVFVSSDASEVWSGMLWLPPDSTFVTTLSGRDYDDQAHNYAGSCLEAAGLFARASGIADGNGRVLDLSAGICSTAGDWFVFDYQAEAVGTCYLGLHEYGIDPDNPPLPLWFKGYEPPAGIEILLDLAALNHVPSRDYDGDSRVNFVDFAILADQWQNAAGADPNTAPSSDLDANEAIDVYDLALFCQYWLERTDANIPPADPNDSAGGL